MNYFAATWYQMTHGPVPVWELGVEDPCSTEQN